MAKNFKRMLSATLAIAMLMSMTVTAFAAETETDLSMNEIKPLSLGVGEDSYVYKLTQDPDNNFYYYETSNHALEIKNAGAVHSFVIVNTEAQNNVDWAPNGAYNAGTSNYDVVYCCDAETGAEAGEFYKRLNIEDSEYLTEAKREQLRAILINSYPFVSIEEMRDSLAKQGFKDADQIDQSDAIAAVQAAVWKIANPDNPDGNTFDYRTTVSTAKKLTWGGYLHEFNFNGSTKYADNEARVNGLINFFLNDIEPVAVNEHQIVITDIEMVGREYIENGSSNVTLKVALNHAVDSERDDISIYAVVNGVKVSEVELEKGAVAELTLNELKIGDEFTVVVEGTQNLDKGVYFYAPKPEDVDGDGEITAREVSQNFIGVGAGKTPVYAEKTYRIKTDKTAEPLDENDNTDVTLTVSDNTESTPGSNLGVDIIYILGGFLSEEQVMTNTMINALIDTFREIIAGGTTVNFGVVPFSSTLDPVMKLTALTSEADLEALPAKLAAAIKEAGNVYDGVNMENALLTATEMFSASELGQMGRTDRQHLVMVSSGHTYYFNSGANNEYISTVPVSFKNGTVDTDEIFYMEKAWMRARNNSTNSYPVPKAITEYYIANTDKYTSEWDCYWSLIDQWAKADIAAGDTIVYEATTREAADFNAWMSSGKYSSAPSTFTYSGNGAVISNPTEEDVKNTLEFDMTNSAERGVVHGVSGPNPFLDETAAHAISYERAMWEAYTFIQENITGKDINFYPVYNPLRENGTASNGSHYDYTWTTNYIGHCFMNMLATLVDPEATEAVWYSSDKVFFDDIKAEIVEAAGSEEASKPASVVDYIGYDAEKGNFEFIENDEYITLTVDGVAYTTKQTSDTAEGSSYAFTAPDASTPTFWVNYYYGDGMEKEYFEWTFGEALSADISVSLTYKLHLIDKAKVDGKYVIETNESATYYPPDGDDQIFPVPKVDYKVNSKKTITFESGDASNISFMLIDKATGKVEFLKKIDIGNETSFEIPAEEGKISAVFVKQSTSGMFWFAEEVDEDIQKAVIDCLKANNPSYKGHNAIAFGEGEHQLEFKKGKFVTYTFSDGEGNLEESVTTPVVKEEVVEEESKVEEVEKPEEESKESSNKKADKKAEKEAEKAAKKNNKKK